MTHCAAGRHVPTQIERARATTKPYSWRPAATNNYLKYDNDDDDEIARANLVGSGSGDTGARSLPCSSRSSRMSLGAPGLASADRWRIGESLEAQLAERQHKQQRKEDHDDADDADDDDLRAGSHRRPAGRGCGFGASRERLQECGGALWTAPISGEINTLSARLNRSGLSEPPPRLGRRIMMPLTSHPLLFAPAGQACEPPRLRRPNSPPSHCYAVLIT